MKIPEDMLVPCATLGKPLSIKLLAEIFWDLDDYAQGRFFDELGTLVMATPAPFSREIGSMSPLDYQMYMASTRATPLGKDAMSRFSEAGIQILNPNWAKA